MRVLLAGIAAASLLTAMSGAAQAASLFTANLTSLNNSGVSGRAYLTLDEKAKTLNVKIGAKRANAEHAPCSAYTRAVY